MDHGMAHEHAEPAGQAGDQGGESTDGCDLCSAYCSLTPLVSDTPAIAAPPDATVKFPVIAPAAPSFVSGGQERPPRTT
jgi:hypothetical protein